MPTLFDCNYSLPKNGCFLNLERANIYSHFVFGSSVWLRRYFIFSFTHFWRWYSSSLGHIGQRIQSQQT